MNLLNYIKGDRDGSNAHYIVLEAMRDSFISDALDGYNLFQYDHAREISRIAKEIDKKVFTSGNIKKIGIIVAALACVFLLIWIYRTAKENIPLKPDIEAIEDIGSYK